MRPMFAYLIVYFALVLGAVAVLWRVGFATQVSPGWLFFGAFVAVALGLVLALLSMNPSQPRTRE